MYTFESPLTFNSPGTVFGLPSPSAALAALERDAENECWGKLGQINVGKTTSDKRITAVI